MESLINVRVEIVVLFRTLSLVDTELVADVTEVLRLLELIHAQARERERERTCEKVRRKREGEESVR